jgi:transposase-like protein
LRAGVGHGKRLIVETNLPREGVTATTTAAKSRTSVVSIEALLGQQGELFKRLLKESLQEVLEAEMTEVAGAAPGERTADRSGWRASSQRLAALL